MITVNADAGSRGNPGPSAIGVIVRDGEAILEEHASFLGPFFTNNVAEYRALITALQLARKYSPEVTCIVDSELVVKQLLGEYQVKNPKLLPLFLEVQQLQESFTRISYYHASREDRFQQIADRLVNQELESRGFKKKLPRRRKF